MAIGSSRLTLDDLVTLHSMLADVESFISVRCQDCEDGYGSPAGVYDDFHRVGIRISVEREKLESTYALQGLGKL